MVKLAGSSLCTVDVDGDVVYRMRVTLGRDEALKVGELTDTGTRHSLQVGSELVEQQSEIQDRIKGLTVILNCHF